MFRSMIFIDYENFDIAKYNYYKKIQLQQAVELANANGTTPPTTIKPTCPSLDYNKLPQEIAKLAGENIQLLKTFLFIPKPDDFLMQDSGRLKKYNWQIGMKNQDFFDVIEGRHTARPMPGFTTSTMNIYNHNSYFIDEKGTDINLATHVLTKAFHNSYDIAIIVSADTDYIPVMDVLNTIGKSVIIAGVKGQNLFAFKQHSDRQIIIDDGTFNKCIRDT